MNQKYVSIIVTKRCNSKCQMCDCWKNPSNPNSEITLDVLERLPKFKNISITGGEPFIREDIEDVVNLLQHKSNRILINTNGSYTDRIINLARKFPKVGIRISIDGTKETHNRIRGINIYDQAMTTLNQLSIVRGGKRDLGIAFTLQDSNYKDLIPLYQWSRENNYEFGFTVVHNSSYYNKSDNEIMCKDKIENEIDILVHLLLQSKRPKDWFRAFFVDAEKTYLRNSQKPIRCEAGTTSFFITEIGNVLPCNGTPNDLVMGNLNNMSWNDIMRTSQAKKIIKFCQQCSINCWSICNVGSAINNHLDKPIMWILKNKLKNA